MGGGASVPIPEVLDEAACRRAVGVHFDQEKFRAIAVDGTITRAQLQQESFNMLSSALMNPEGMASMLLDSCQGDASRVATLVKAASTRRSAHADRPHELTAPNDLPPLESPRDVAPIAPFTPRDAVSAHGHTSPYPHHHVHDGSPHTNADFPGSPGSVGLSCSMSTLSRFEDVGFGVSHAYGRETDRQGHEKGDRQESSRPRYRSGRGKKRAPRTSRRAVSDSDEEDGRSFVGEDGDEESPAGDTKRALQSMDIFEQRMQSMWARVKTAKDHGGPTVNATSRGTGPAVEVKQDERRSTGCAHSPAGKHTATAKTLGDKVTESALLPEGSCPSTPTERHNVNGMTAEARQTLGNDAERGPRATHIGAEKHPSVEVGDSSNLPISEPLPSPLLHREAEEQAGAADDAFQAFCEDAEHHACELYHGACWGSPMALWLRVYHAENEDATEDSTVGDLTDLDKRDTTMQVVGGGYNDVVGGVFSLTGTQTQIQAVDAPGHDTGGPRDNQSNGEADRKASSGADVPQSSRAAGQNNRRFVLSLTVRGRISTRTVNLNLFLERIAAPEVAGTPKARYARPDPDGVLRTIALSGTAEEQDDPPEIRLDRQDMQQLRALLCLRDWVKDLSVVRHWRVVRPVVEWAPTAIKVGPKSSVQAATSAQATRRRINGPEHSQQQEQEWETGRRSAPGPDKVFCPHVSQLSLFDCELSVDTDSLGTRVLSRLPQLTHLRLKTNLSLTGDVSLLVLGLPTCLMTLDLTDTGVNGSIDYVSTLSSLKQLLLSRTRVNGDLSALKTLTRLSKLHLDETAVSGDLGHLGGLSFLSILNLSHTKVTCGEHGTMGRFTALITSHRLRKVNLMGCRYLSGLIPEAVFDTPNLSVLLDGSDLRLDRALDSPENAESGMYCGWQGADVPGSEEWTRKETQMGAGAEHAASKENDAPVAGASPHHRVGVREQAQAHTRRAVDDTDMDSASAAANRVTVDVAIAHVPFVVMSSRNLLACRSLPSYEEALRENMLYLTDRHEGEVPFFRFMFVSVDDMDVKHARREEIGFLSHEWLAPAADPRVSHPDDKKRSKLAHIKQVVARHPDLKFWWLDFFSLPQECGIETRKQVVLSVPHFIKCCGAFFALVNDTCGDERYSTKFYRFSSWRRLELLAGMVPYSVMAHTMHDSEVSCSADGADTQQQLDRNLPSAGSFGPSASMTQSLSSSMAAPGQTQQLPFHGILSMGPHGTEIPLEGEVESLDQLLPSAGLLDDRLHTTYGSDYAAQRNLQRLMETYFHRIVEDEEDRHAEMEASAHQAQRSQAAAAAAETSPTKEAQPDVVDADNTVASMQESQIGTVTSVNTRAVLQMLDFGSERNPAERPRSPILAQLQENMATERFGLEEKMHEEHRHSNVIGEETKARQEDDERKGDEQPGDGQDDAGDDWSASLTSWSSLASLPTEGFTPSLGALSERGSRDIQLRGPVVSKMMRDIRPVVRRDDPRFLHKIKEQRG